MLKKFMCLTAVLAFVAACDTTDQDSTNNIRGLNGKGMTADEVRSQPGTEEGLVKIGDRVFFEFNQSDLDQDSRETLDRQTVWLKKYNHLKVTIEGHCDERGTREYNIALGQRRATAAKNYLVANGISAGRVKTISYGKERPAVMGHDEDAWAQNRRAVTVVVE